MNKTLNTHIRSSVYDIIIRGKQCKFFFSALCYAIVINKIIFLFLENNFALMN